MIFVILLIIFGSLVFIGFLLTLVYKRSNYRIKRYVSQLETAQKLSAEDLNVLKLHYPQYLFDTNIHNITGCFYCRSIITGVYQGQKIKEWCYFIDNLETTFLAGISKQCLDDNLNKSGHFQIVVFRDTYLMRTHVAIINFFNAPYLMNWLEEKKNNLFYKGKPEKLDDQGTHLINKRKATKEELKVIRSIEVDSYRMRDGFILIGTFLFLFMGTLFMMIIQRYEYSYLLCTILLFLIYRLIKLKPPYNESLDFVNIICGDVIFNEKNKKFYIGSLEIKNQCYELARKHQGKKNITAAVVNLESPYTIISINNELMPCVKHYDHLYIALMFLAIYCGFIGFFYMLFD